MKDTLPVVTYLRDDALKQNHKEEIYKLLEKPIDIESEDVTLKTLLDMNVKSKKEQIGEIQMRARKEKELTQEYEQHLNLWKSYELPIQGYKDTKDIFVLASCEEMIEVLEDSLLKISGIVSHKYSKPIRIKV